jgi:hypothetical protein
MKKILSFLLLSVLFSRITNGQTTVIQGKPIAEIFTDFHYVVNDSLKYNGFDLNRAHLGYNFQPGGNFSSTIIVNVASPIDLPAGSKAKRYAFFREASITYSKDKLTVAWGMVNTRTFDFQQRFWGKRYITAEFQALYGYGSVADLGVVADYKINDIFKVDLSFLNGDGYLNIQMDNSIKTTFGVTATLPNKLSFRLYGDIMKPKGILQNTFIGFAGYANDIISIGAEASYKTNIDLTEGHDAWGLSSTVSLFPNKKYEFFTRVDYSASVKVPGDQLQWAYKLDGIYLISGIQRNFTNNIKLALNYRGVFPYDSSRNTTSAIYLNALFKF